MATEETKVCIECYNPILPDDLHAQEDSLSPGEKLYRHIACFQKMSDGAKADYERMALRNALRESEKIEYEAELRTNLLKGKWFLKGAETLIRINPIYYDKTAAWWVWNHTTLSWEQKDETDILVLCKKSLELIGDTSVRHGNSLLKALQQIGRQRQPDELSPEWIQFGINQINVQTGAKRLSSPQWFSTNSIPWDIGDSTETPVIDALIASWVGPDRVQTIHEIIAYCAYRDYPIHRVFCFVGSGANGKTRLLKIIEKFIGQDNKSSVTLKKMTGNNFALYPLYRKLACFVGETAHHNLDSTEIVKALSGQDPVSFEAKGRDAFTGINYAKLFIGTNTLPTSSDNSRGWFRRWFIIRFPNEFKEGEDILNRIPETEYNNLAAKCVKILPDLIRRGSFTGEGTIEDRRETYVKNSNPIKAYLEEFYDRDPDAITRYTEVYIEYLNYLSELKLRRISRKEFSKSLEDEGLEAERKSYREHVTGDVTTYFVIFGLKRKPAQRTISSSETSTVRNTGMLSNTLTLPSSQTLKEELGSEYEKSVTEHTSITTVHKIDDKNNPIWLEWLNNQNGGTASVDEFIRFLAVSCPGISYQYLKSRGEVYEPRSGFVRGVL